MADENESKEYVKNTKSKVIPKTYFATKEDLDNPRMRHGSSQLGVYKNIKTWRK